MEYSSVRWKTWLYPGGQELNYCLSSLNTQELLRAAFAVFAARHVHSPPRTICTRHLALFGHNRLDAKGTMHRWEDENCPWIALVRSLQCQCATRELENKRLRLEVQSDFHWICSKSGNRQKCLLFVITNVRYLTMNKNNVNAIDILTHHMTSA